MKRLPGWLAASTLAAAIAATAACDDNGSRRGTFTGGLVSSPSATFAVTVAPISMPLIPSPTFLCPLTQPFSTTFDLVVVPARDVVIDGLTLSFIDGLGVRSSSLFTGSRLATLLGTTTLLGGVQRSFVLQPQFGCGLAIPRSVNVQVGMIDVLGTRFDSTATGSLR